MAVGWCGYVGLIFLELFSTPKQNIDQLISKMLLENELDKDPVVKNFFTTAVDGKKYNVIFYSLEMIIAVGYRVRGIFAE